MDRPAHTLAPEYRALLARLGFLTEDDLRMQLPSSPGASATASRRQPATSTSSRFGARGACACGCSRPAPFFPTTTRVRSSPAKSTAEPLTAPWRCFSLRRHPTSPENS